MRHLGDLVAEADLRAVISEHGAAYCENGDVFLRYSEHVGDVLRPEVMPGQTIMWRVVMIYRERPDGSTYAGRWFRTDANGREIV